MRLSLLVAGTTLPLIIFAAGLVYVYHERSRDLAFDRVLETVRNIRLVLDSQMQSLTSGLEVLALSQALQRDDLDGFRRDAEAFANRFPEESAVLLADRTGRQLLNTRVAAGEPLPPRSNQATTDEVFRTGRPVYSALFTASVAQRRIVTIEVPVRRNGDVVYVISFNPPLRMFQSLIEEQRPGPDWTVSIFDQAGLNFARVPNPDLTIGQRASPTLFAAFATASEAKTNTVSLEGTPLLTAFTRSALTGWRVAAGIPAQNLTAPLWNTLAITALIGTLLLATGLLFAIGMARQIARAETLQQMLVNELNHRVKNTLAMVQSLVTQTFRPGVDTVEARRKFDARLLALGRAHGVLGERKWESAGINEIVAGVIAPYTTDSGRIKASGQDMQLSAANAVVLSMILHELATNALKYGALSDPYGRVTIGWNSDGAGGLRLTWQELNGPAVTKPERTGFGSRLISGGFAAQGGRADLRYEESGLVCEVYCPQPGK
jgi:two-component sensor histidine kinase